MGGARPWPGAATCLSSSSQRPRAPDTRATPSPSGGRRPRRDSRRPHGGQAEQGACWPALTGRPAEGGGEPQASRIHSEPGFRFQNQSAEQIT